MAEWIECESKKESFGIDISDVHESNAIEVSDDDKNRRIRTIITAKGKFKRRLMEAKISVGDRPTKDLRDLPLSVEIHFDELAKYASIKEPVGMLTFHEAFNSGRVVDEPDQLKGRSRSSYIRSNITPHLPGVAGKRQSLDSFKFS